MDELLNLLDFEAAARAGMDRAAFDYIAGGAMDEVTLRENRLAFERLRLRPRVLVDVSRRDLSVPLLGRTAPSPLVIAPAAFHGLAHSEAELATARAAAAEGVTLVLSTLSNSAMEAIRTVSSGPLWFQLYVYRDRGLTRELVARAEVAGCEALVLTVDVPILGRRERDVRSRFTLPSTLELGNLSSAGISNLPVPIADSAVALHFAHLIDPSLQWSDLAWLHSITRLPILVKGICRGDDARRARQHGAAGIVVSNHGGRQLDTAVAAIDALPEVVEAVGGEVEILLDGGIRRGTDVIKALALGAGAVMLARPILWGLAVGGEAGVRRVLALLRDELDLALALVGCPRAAELTRDLVT